MLTAMRTRLFDEVAQIIGTVLREPPPQDAAALAEDFQRWDSHATVEIIFAIEDRFGFEMSPEQMEKVAGVSSLIDIVIAHVGPDAGLLP